jgi:hypothetical protein
MAATLSLTNTVTFLTMLCALVDTMSEKLHIFSKFTVEQGWLPDDANLRANSRGSLCAKRRSLRCDDIG